MKFHPDKKYVHAGVTAFLTVVCCLLFYWIVTDWHMLFSGVQKVMETLNPLVYGLVFAFLLAPVCNFVETHWFMPLCKRIFKKRPQNAPRVARGFSVAVSLIFGIAVVSAIVWLIIPQTYDSIKTVIQEMPGYIEEAILKLEKWAKSDSSIEAQLQGVVDSIYNSALNWVETGLLPRMDDILVQVTTGIVSVVKVAFDVVVGLVITVYLLADKENFFAQCKKAVYCLFPQHTANEIVKTASFTFDMFGNFITARLIDGAIIGVINYILMLIFGMEEYAVLISVIVGVTNIIPFFGPFIGAIPSALLLLIVDPVQCLIFIIYTIVLQQVDGNIIGPALLGRTTGIGSFWVIVALLVGGGLFGFVGMVCAVPLFAVVYALLKKAGNERLVKKGLEKETVCYERLAYIDEETGEHVFKGSVPAEKEKPEEPAENEK